MKRTAFGFFLAAFILSLITSCGKIPTPPACGDPLGCLVISADRPAELGVILAAYGEYASLGIDAWRGMVLAVSHFGTLNGHSIGINRQATDCTGEAARTGAIQLTLDPDLLAVLGPSCDLEISAMGTLAAAGVPASRLVPDHLTPIDPGISLSPNDAACQPVQFLIIRLGIKRLALLTEQNAAGRTYWLDLLTRCSEGTKLNIIDEINLATNTGFPAAVTRLAADSPDAAFIILPPGTAGLLVRQIRAASSLQGLPILGSDTLFSREFVERAGQAGPGLYLVGPDLTGFPAQYPEFASRYRETYDEPPSTPYSAAAYAFTLRILQSLSASAWKGADGSLYLRRTDILHSLAFPPGTPCSGSPAVTPGTPLPWIDCPGRLDGIYQITNSNPANWDPGENPVRIYP